MLAMIPNNPLGYVTNLRWKAEELNGKKAMKTVTKGNITPATVLMQGQFAAKKHKEGMFLVFETTRENGTKAKWPLSQKQADSVFVNKNGDFEITEI